MGNNCGASCAKNFENKHEFCFSKILESQTISYDEDDTSTSNGKILYSSTINKQDFIKIKNTFENILQKHGEFILNTTITDILNQTNPLANKIKLKPNIENLLKENCFIAPPIKFHSGEIYQGSWNINNQREGFGINITPEGNVYKGLWENDKVGKYGFFIDISGNYYLGDLEDGKSEGKGEMLMVNKMKYIGNFSNDLPNGEGKIENYEDNSVYIGEVVNGVKEGKGILIYEDGVKYSGMFKGDKFEGKGVLELGGGKRYEGEFLDNKLYGKGKYIWGDGTVYEGDYEDFMREGNGKEFWDENKSFDCDWTYSGQ